MNIHNGKTRSSCNAQQCTTMHSAAVDGDRNTPRSTAQLMCERALTRQQIIKNLFNKGAGYYWFTGFMVITWTCESKNQRPCHLHELVA